MFLLQKLTQISLEEEDYAEIYEARKVRLASYDAASPGAQGAGFDAAIEGIGIEFVVHSKNMDMCWIENIPFLRG